MAGADHWDERYRTVGADAVSWFEPHPTTSLELLVALGVTPADSVIDVGGGASVLVDALLVAGHTDVTVLDLSEAALATARGRLGDPAGVAWVEHDLLTWEPERTWDAWHDRAVLHFLTDDHQRSTYADLLRRALRPRGGFVVGTFAEDGPEQCSQLPVRRYAPGEVADLLRGAGAVEVVEERRVVHHTPTGAPQPFNWVAGRLA